MKITHRKQKGERYALVFETKEEAKEFAHYIECGEHTACSCSMPNVKNGDFGNRLRGVIFGKKFGDVTLPA